jgi:chromosome segregation ATPase
MSQLSSQREPHRNGLNGSARRGPEPAGDSHDWADDAVRQQIERLAEDNKQLLAAMGAGSPAPGSADEEVELLRGENAELRQRIEELEQSLLEHVENDWVERQKDYEALLEEKSEVIRGLHQKIQELREAGAAHSASGPPPSEGPADPIDEKAFQDLLALKRRLEEERGQLQQDEEALEQQMRQMEMAMSRERAELARQRAELQRLHNDLKHEMEQASRDAVLRERLLPLQRRQQEVTGRKNTLADIPVAPPASSSKRPGSGIFGRLFGSGE